MVRLKHKLTEPPQPPERGVKAATFRLLLDTAMALIQVRRPRPVGGRGRGALQGLARHRLPLLPEPQRAGHGGGRHLARAGAQLRVERGRRPRAGARAVRADLPALQGVRAADARRGAAGARAVGARARRPARGGAVPARPPRRASSSTRSRRSRRTLPAAVRDRLHRALSVVYGIEPYMILKDIWGLPDREVERIALWMADALIDAAQRDAAAARPRARAPRAVGREGRRRPTARHAHERAPPIGRRGASPQPAAGMVRRAIQQPRPHPRASADPARIGPTDRPRPAPRCRRRSTSPTAATPASGSTCSRPRAPRRAGAGLHPRRLLARARQARRLLHRPALRRRRRAGGACRTTRSARRRASSEIVRQQRAGAGLGLAPRRRAWRRPGTRIVVAGHSAGGHLAAMMLATDWPAVAPDLPADLVQGRAARSPACSSSSRCATRPSSRPTCSSTPPRRAASARSPCRRRAAALRRSSAATRARSSCARTSASPRRGGRPRCRSAKRCPGDIT